MGQPNIFAVVGGPQFSIYEIMPKRNIKLVMCYEDADVSFVIGISNNECIYCFKILLLFCDFQPNEDFYTCCWSLSVSTKKSVLIVGGVRGIIRIFDIEQAQVNPKNLIGHGGAVNQVKISPRIPFLLASASKDHSIRLWNIETKVCIATFHAIQAHRDEVVSIDFNRDCTKLVSGGLDHMIAIWDLTIPEILRAIEQSKRYNEIESKCAVKTVYHPFPIFSTRQLHNNYVDCVQWFGDFVLSKVSGFISI